jgi:hypothetical protein
MINIGFNIKPCLVRCAATMLDQPLLLARQQHWTKRNFLPGIIALIHLSIHFRTLQSLGLFQKKVIYITFKE